MSVLLVLSFCVQSFDGIQYLRSPGGDEARSSLVNGTRAPVGVELYPQINYTTIPPKAEDTVKYTHLQGYVTFNITIKNTGSGAGSVDKILVGCTGYGAGTDFYIDIPPDEGNPNPSYVKLGPNETTNVTLNVGMSSNPNYNIAKVEITGQSTLDPSVYVSLMTYTVLSKWNFTCEFPIAPDNNTESKWYGQKWTVVEPGQEYMFYLELNNTGNCNDTYDLELTGIPEGWSVIFGDSRCNMTIVSLMAYLFEGIFPGDHNISVPFKVTVPVDATLDPECDLKATAVSRTPGSRFENNGICSDGLLMIAGYVEHWGPPICNDTAKDISPNETIEYELEVQNLANNNVTFRFLVRGLPDGWSLDFLDSRPLLPGQSVILPLRLTAPSDAAWGFVANISVTYTILSDESLPLFLTATVRQIHAFWVSVTPNSVSAYPGENTTFATTVVNIGNGPDVISMYTKTNDAALNARIYRNDTKPMYLLLERWESADLSIVIRVERDALPGRYEAYINFTCGNISEVRTVFVDVLVPINGPGNGSDTNGTGGNLPDLAFGAKIFWSPSPVFEGYKVNVDVKLINQGTAIARNVTVILWVDYELAGSLVIDAIGPGAIEWAVFVWPAEYGLYNITVVIDPDDRVFEPNDQFRGTNNNVQTVQLPVGADEDEVAQQDDSIVIVLVLAAAFVILAAVAIAWIVVKKNQPKPPTPRSRKKR